MIIGKTRVLDTHDRAPLILSMRPDQHPYPRYTTPLVDLAQKRRTIAEEIFQRNQRTVGARGIRAKSQSLSTTSPLVAAKTIQQNEARGLLPELEAD